jgi:hypothetical protein
MRYTELRAGAGRKKSHSNPMQWVDYLVDFEITAARALGCQSIEWRVFWYHHLFWVPWPQCGVLTKLNRGNFFYTVYRVEVAVGRACMESSPYTIWPGLYFAGK